MRDVVVTFVMVFVWAILSNAIPMVRSTCWDENSY